MADLDPDEGGITFDQIALDLQELREASGSVSYAELVRRISALRLARGVNAAASFPPRSTVYHAFSMGRSRMDTELVRDIVRALGASEDEADAWVERCRHARKAVDQCPPVPSATRSVSAAPRLPRIFVPLMLVGCVALNLLGLTITAVFKLSVYLDMVGTVIASIMFGPWHGVIVALVSSNLGFLTGDPTTWYFTPVNLAGALLWGYGVRKFAFGNSFTGFLALNAIVALGCSLVAAPILVQVFGQSNVHASTQGTLSLEALGLPLIAATFSSNLVTSLFDKLLSGLFALSVCAYFHRRWGVPTEHMRLVERLRPAG